METLFGRKKTRSRQVSAELNERSVPYERVTPGSRAPLPIGTLSNGQRNTVYPNEISAPLQNPTLTANGTEMNLSTTQPKRAQRDTRQSEGSQRPTSPPVSMYSARSMSSNATGSDTRSTRHTVDSSMSSGASSTTPTSPYTTSSHRLRDRDIEGTPKGRFSGLGEFGSQASMNLDRFPYNGATVRPASMATSRSDASRASRFPSVVLNSEHLSINGVPHHPPKYTSALEEEFHFPRPKTSRDIESMFDEVQATRNISNLKQLNDLSIEHKWLMVYNDELERWREEKRRMTEGNRQAKDSPEWFLKKFMDQTIQPRQIASLAVSLRTMPVQ